MPTSTPTATLTATPTATAARARATARPTTPAPTATPSPSLSAPILLRPEAGTTYNGASAIIELAWSSSHTLEPEEYFEVTVRYTESGAEVNLPIYVQTTSWFVSRTLLGKADQETRRIYIWGVRVVRQEAASSGEPVYLPMSPASEERSFYWIP